MQTYHIVIDYIPRLLFIHLPTPSLLVTIRLVSKMMVRCQEVGGNALTICMLSGLRTSFIFVKGSAKFPSFHTAVEAIFKKQM